jgi:hypothetical protein
MSYTGIIRGMACRRCSPKRFIVNSAAALLSILRPLLLFLLLFLLPLLLLLDDFRFRDRHQLARHLAEFLEGGRFGWRRWFVAHLEVPAVMSLLRGANRCSIQSRNSTATGAVTGANVHSRPQISVLHSEIESDFGDCCDGPFSISFSDDDIFDPVSFRQELKQ